MHDVELPQFITDRNAKRRGRSYVFETLDPARTALVVIDMQRAFVDEGAPMEVPVARGIVPNINRLASAMREAGGAVMWIAMTMAESGPDHFPIYYEYFFQEEGRRRHREALTEGSELHAIYPALDVRADEDLVLKNRFSAFIQGSSDIDARCKARGIDTVIITGTLTDVCCESSARDAMMLDYRVLMPADANATLSDEEHLGGLMAVAQYFGDVRETDEIVALIEAGARGREAAE